MNRSPPEEREDFLRKITALNLKRIWWMSLTCANASGAIFAYNTLYQKHSPLLGTEEVDLLASIVVLLLAWRVRRKPLPEPWGRVFVVAVVFATLGIMDFYFFTALPAFGHNSSYVLGAIICGVLFVLPSEFFLTVLLINHAIYCTFLLTSVHGMIYIAPAIADGTTGVLIAGLASRFLYTAKWSDFRKERVITLRSRQLAASNAELKWRNDEMNEMMAIAAHDLRSPLQGQRNLLDLVRSRLTGESTPITKALDTAILSCEDILSMMTRMLDAHAAEHHARPVACQRGDLRGRIEAAVQRARATDAAKTISIECELPAIAAEAIFDSIALDLVLDNLLSNAIKFSPASSQITVNLVSKEGIWSIEVSDEGPGISEEDRASLFKKFYRGPNLPTGGEKSTGLGLFIVKKLMESMRGSVEYAARNPQGSIFRIEFAREKVGEESGKTS